MTFGVFAPHSNSHFWRDSCPQTDLLSVERSVNRCLSCFYLLAVGYGLRSCPRLDESRLDRAVAPYIPRRGSLDASKQEAFC